MASTTYTTSLITKRIVISQEYVDWRSSAVLFTTLSQDINDELETLYPGRLSGALSIHGHYGNIWAGMGLSVMFNILGADTQEDIDTIELSVPVYEHTSMARFTDTLARLREVNATNIVDRFQPVVGGGVAGTNLSDHVHTYGVGATSHYAFPTTDQIVNSLNSTSATIRLNEDRRVPAGAIRPVSFITDSFLKDLAEKLSISTEVSRDGTNLVVKTSLFIELEDTSLITVDSFEGFIDTYELEN